MSHRRILVTASLALTFALVVVGGAVVTLGRQAAVDHLAVPDHLDGTTRPVAIHRTPGAGSGSPIMYLFPGRGGDDSQWFAGHPFADGVGIDLIADELVADGRIEPMVLVSADIGDTYGVDSTPVDDGYEHGRVERYILDDLIPTVEARYGTPSERWIGGLSMGGFAALHAAFRQPDLFDAVGVLSPAIFEGDLPDRMWLFEGEGGRPAHDPLELARSGSIEDLRIGLGAGLSDYPWIHDATTVLGRILTQRQVAHELDFVAGGHDTATWHALAPHMLLALGASRGVP